MIRLFSTVLLLFFAGVIPAQQLTPATISSAGNSKLAGNVLLEDNMGGLIINSISTPAVLYTQGFLQPDAGTITVLPPINDVVLNSGTGMDNAGTTFISGNIMLEFTVGEVASKTLGDVNNLLTQGILQPYGTGSVLPVTGLEFYARRISNTTVQLDWKTIQELNNKGFHVERKKENENSFADAGFVASNTADGNSAFPLTYQTFDHNNFHGSTYYRIRQEDLDGRTSYSVVRLVKGDQAQQLTLQVWPVPATGFFHVAVNGLAKADVIQVLDMNGRLVKQFSIQNQAQQQVSGLPPGMYFVKLLSDRNIMQKIIVQ